MALGFVGQGANHAIYVIGQMLLWRDGVGPATCSWPDHGRAGGGTHPPYPVDEQ